MQNNILSNAGEKDVKTLYSDILTSSGKGSAPVHNDEVNLSWFNREFDRAKSFDGQASTWMKFTIWTAEMLLNIGLNWILV